MLIAVVKVQYALTLGDLCYSPEDNLNYILKITRDGNKGYQDRHNREQLTFCQLPFILDLVPLT
jgi:hypothetical protein